MSELDAPALPNTLPRPRGELEALKAAWEPPRGWRRITSVNNTDIGPWYLATALGFFVFAGVIALLMRWQLALPDHGVVTSGTYNQLFTMHGTVMMFLFAVPVVEAIAVYLLPGMLGARDLPFPRLSAYAFWAYAIGGAAFCCTIFFDVSPDGGWFMYPPLSGAEQSPGLGADFWLLGIGFIEISAIAGAVELIVGIGLTRAPGMTLARMPVYAWAMWVVAWMIVFAFPAIIAGTALLELERAFDWPIFIAERGGDPLIWQHLFWFFGHPEVYIIFLPAAGLVSMMFPVIAGTALVGRKAVIAALIVVGVLSFGLWVHHMFTAGLSRWASVAVSVLSLAIAVPTSVQVFAWLATLRRGQVAWHVSTLFLLGFLFIFVLGGLTGVMVAVLPFDLQVHDTYFIVAHLHYVLIGGMVFPMFAALYHWMPLLRGVGLAVRHGRIAFGLMFFGFNLAFFPMHITGLLGMPRRVHTYADGLGWNVPNLLSTVGAFVFAAGVVLVFFDLVRTLRRPSAEHADPWRAATLEWLPNESYGTRSIPQITSVDPLWQQPGLAKQVAEGRHWLPGTALGGRETIVTSFVDARPLALLRLPNDSALPLLAALGTAGFFLLLTVKATVIAWACAIVAVVAIWLWLQQLDRAPLKAQVQIGDGVHVPVGLRGRHSHALWAIVIVLLVDASVFASMLFAHVHVSMLAEVCPPPGAALPTLGATFAAVAAQLVASGPVALAHAARARRLVSACAVAAGIALSVASFALGWQAVAGTGLNPRVDAWQATVATLLAYQGLHVLLLLMMGGYWIAASARGRLAHVNATTADVIAVTWHYVGLQALVLAVALHALPPLMNG